MSQQDTDPLDGADVGHTETVRETIEIPTWDISRPDVCWGSDRFSNVTVEDAEVVGEGDDERVVLTYSGEVTKRLPRRWDYSREPLTEEAERAQRWRKWAGNVVGAVIVIAGVVLASWIATDVTNTIVGQMTVNGESLPTMSVAETAMLTVPVFAIAALIVFGQRWLPRGYGRRT